MEPNPFQSSLHKVGPLETKSEGPEIIREMLEFVVSYNVLTDLVHFALQWAGHIYLLYRSATLTWCSNTVGSVSN